MAVGWRGSNAMPSSLELKPEVEERLGREASAKGPSVEAYVEDLIEQKVVRLYDASRIDPVELDRVLDSLNVPKIVFLKNLSPYSAGERNY
jgi:predicted DNA-binding protein